MGVRSYVCDVTLVIAKIVAFCGSWLRGKASCKKHSLGRGAPWRPECLVFNKNRLKISLIILIVSIACLSGKLMEICTSEPDSTAEKTKR